MINIKNVNRFCNGDITQIENYERAINDDTQMWDCHHRRETDENKSRQQLKDQNLYFNRPSSELIFLTPSEHRSLHSSGEKNPNYGKSPWNKDKKTGHQSEEHKKNLSEALKGKPHSENHKQKISESLKGKHKSEEWKQKKSDTYKGNKRIIKDGKGAYCKPEELEYYLNNGWQLQKYKKKEQ